MVKNDNNKAKIDASELVDIIINNRYKSIENRDEQLGAIHNDLSKLTDNLSCYGDTLEKQVLNYCTYKQDLVLGFYRIKLQ